MKKSLIFVAAILSLFVAEASAIDIENFQPAIGTQNLITVYTSTTYAQGQFGIMAMANYAANPLLFSFENDEQLKIVEQMTTSELQASVGLFKFWEIGVAGNFHTVAGSDMDRAYASVLNQNQETAFPETDATNASSMGDVRAMMKFRFFENKSGSIGVALVPTASFPTGDPDAYAGAEAVNAGGRLVLDKRYERVNFVLNGGYVYMGDADGADKGFDPSGRAEFGAGVTVTAHKYIELLAEVYGRTVDYKLDKLDPQIPTEALGAMKLYAGPVHFTLGGGAGVNSGIGNPAYRAFAGIGLTVPKQERVKRAVMPVIPMESKTLDSDKDGLSNYDETKVTMTDPLIPDTDGDGLKDGEEVQTYKTDPLKADTDGDGLTDYEEVSVYGTDPLKADTDGDGLKDGAEVKQYRTNPIDADTDHDGVPDDKDGAPLQPETINGIRDEDGIPEVILAIKPSGITLTDSLMWIPGKFVFTGPKNDRPDPQTKLYLKDIAALMTEYPAMKIEVQGHCAPGENKDADLASTSKAAASIAVAIVKDGVSAARIESKGYGSDYPIAPNTTPEGRDKNQRIEIVITEK